MPAKSLGKSGCFALGLVVAVAAGACRGGSDDGSRTPRITVDASGPVAPALLTTEELRSVDLIAGDITAVPLKDLSVFVDPDPRGPCGAKVRDLDLTDGAGIGIRAASVQGAQTVARLTAARSREYFDARSADLRSGCPAYSTTTNRGATQTVQLRRGERYSVGAGVALIVQQTTTIDGRSTEVAITTLVRGPYVAKIVLFAVDRLPVVTLHGLAKTASLALGRVCRRDDAFVC